MVHQLTSWMVITNPSAALHSALKSCLVVPWVQTTWASKNFDENQKSKKKKFICENLYDLTVDSSKGCEHSKRKFHFFEICEYKTTVSLKAVVISCFRCLYAGYKRHHRKNNCCTSPYTHIKWRVIGQWR